MDSDWKTETIQETLDRLTKPHAYKIPHSPVIVVSQSMHDRLKACVTDELSHLWKVGDIVTRDGTDEHEIVGINESRDLLDLVCIKEPADKWIAVGERDSNLTRRYSFVRPGITTEKLLDSDTNEGTSNE